MMTVGRVGACPCSLSDAPLSFCRDAEKFGRFFSSARKDSGYIIQSRIERYFVYIYLLRARQLPECQRRANENRKHVRSPRARLCVVFMNCALLSALTSEDLFAPIDRPSSECLIKQARLSLGNTRVAHSNFSILSRKLFYLLHLNFRQHSAAATRSRSNAGYLDPPSKQAKVPAQKKKRTKMFGNEIALCRNAREQR